MALGGREGGDESGQALEAFTASEKVLREEEVSFFQSSIFLSSVAMVAAWAGGCWGGGSQEASLLGRLVRSAWMEQIPTVMVSVKREEGYRTGQRDLLDSRLRTSRMPIRMWYLNDSFGVSSKSCRQRTALSIAFWNSTRIWILRM